MAINQSGQVSVWCLIIYLFVCLKLLIWKGLRISHLVIVITDIVQNACGYDLMRCTLQLVKIKYENEL